MMDQSSDARLSFYRSFRSALRSVRDNSLLERKQVDSCWSSVAGFSITTLGFHQSASPANYQEVLNRYGYRPLKFQCCFPVKCQSRTTPSKDYSPIPCLSTSAPMKPTSDIGKKNAQSTWQAVVIRVSFVSTQDRRTMFCHHFWLEASCMAKVTSFTTKNLTRETTLPIRIQQLYQVIIHQARLTIQAHDLLFEDDDNGMNLETRQQPDDSTPSRRDTEPTMRDWTWFQSSFFKNHHLNSGH